MQGLKNKLLDKNINIQFEIGEKVWVVDKSDIGVYFATIKGINIDENKNVSYRIELLDKTTFYVFSNNEDDSGTYLFSAKQKAKEKFTELKGKSNE